MTTTYPEMIGITAETMTTVRPRNWFRQLFAKTVEKPRVSDYHAVSICCRADACQAAKNKLGKRHLSAEAPLLPLRQCDRPDQCNCRYQHYDDRRGEPRRRSDQGLTANTDPDQVERRYKKDRRAHDDVDNHEPFSVHEDSYYQHVGDTIRTAMLDAGEQDGFDPYNSGSFDKSKPRRSNPEK